MGLPLDAASLTFKPGTTLYILSCYHPETGELEGYLTDRETISEYPNRALVFLSEKLADARGIYLGKAVGYRFYIWVVEERVVGHNT